MLFRYEAKKVFGNYTFSIMLVFLAVSVLISMYMEGYWDSTVDWLGLTRVLDRFFFVFFLAIIVFVSPVFAGEHEKDMTNLLSTTYKGKQELFLKCKLKVVLFCINTVLFLFLFGITGSYFFQYGFTDCDTSIQSSARYAYSVLDLNFGQLVLYKVIAGILGSNLIGLIMILISMHSRETFHCFMKGIVVIGVFSRNIVLRLIGINIVDYILAFAPINSYKMTIVAIVPDMLHVYAVFIGYIIFAIVLLYRIKQYWHTREFYKTRG